jgi:hypothetical protein
MVDILNSVLIKHDTGFKSLTKIALSQIVLKVIYENKNNGIVTKSIKSKLENYIGVSLNHQDIESALAHLKNESKVNFKSNKYFISESYKSVLDKSVNESENLHNDVINHWFSKSETYQDTNGKDRIYQWFNKLMVDFFKEYRYDWINDLKSKRVGGKRCHFNIEKVLSNCFDKVNIETRDKEWLVNQFSNFLDSNRSEDNELLWLYGTSMFSATLLTAKNFADDFTLDIFKDSYFILDTNILMTMGLEGHDFYYAFEHIENIFKALNITPIYFYITKEEYRRAISRKRQATVNTLDHFGYDVVKETGCGIIATAIRRQCSTVDDFIRFFDELENVPDAIFTNLKIECEDYIELHNAIEQGQYDEETIEKINKINNNRIGRNKSKNVLAHDSGLVQGAIFLNKSKKSWILTKDGTIREYANENILRNNNPIAVGLDSFIQMLAINNGNIQNSTTNFAPLFAKIVQFSLLPEKNIFKAEDLEFILDTKIEIETLKKPDIIEIARNVNKLRIQNKADEDIVLEVRRYFQTKKVDYESEKIQLETQQYELKQDKIRTSRERDNLDSELFTTKYGSTKGKLQRKIFFNWLKFIGIPVLIVVIIIAVNRFIDFNNQSFALYVSIISDVVASLIIGMWKKPKLWYTKKDLIKIKDEIRIEINKVKEKTMK